MKLENITPGPAGRIDFDAFLDVDPAAGRVRVRREALTDPAIFDLEMRHIFEGGWIYLAHESQLPERFDFYTDWMGRQPVIVYRNGEGAIDVFLNACPHRGTTLCRTRQGKRKGFACTYHGWAFDDQGQLVFVPRRDEGYPADFDMAAHGLVRAARVEHYGGFIFASLNPQVVPLREHLGDLLEVIDMLNDQAPGGFEVVKGFNTCTYRGNWKLLLENGSGGTAARLACNADCARAVSRPLPEPASSRRRVRSAVSDCRAMVRSATAIWALAEQASA